MESNTLSAGDIKRRGMAAIEEGLQKGPVRIVKRNRPAAVVLSEADYQRLIGGAQSAEPRVTALQWLLAQPASGTCDREAIDADLQAQRNW